MKIGICFGRGSSDKDDRSFDRIVCLFYVFGWKIEGFSIVLISNVCNLYRLCFEVFIFFQITIFQCARITKWCF